MKLTTIVGVTLITVTALVGVALYFTFNAYLDERETRLQAEFTSKLVTQEAKYKEEKQQAVSATQTFYEERMADLDVMSKERINDLTRQLATARDDAAQMPIEFGDGIMRDFIYVDCLWNQGEASARPEGRAACRDEAFSADPSTTGFSFATLNPEFIKRWGEACREYEVFGGGPEWEAGHPGITPQMCVETLVVFTPEFATYIRIFLQNGEKYTMELLNYALEQNEVIDTLTKRGTQEH